MTKQEALDMAAFGAGKEPNVGSVDSDSIVETAMDLYAFEKALKVLRKMQHQILGQICDQQLGKADVNYDLNTLTPVLKMLQFEEQILVDRLNLLKRGKLDAE